MSGMAVSQSRVLVYGSRYRGGRYRGVMFGKGSEAVECAELGSTRLLPNLLMIIVIH